MADIPSPLTYGTITGTFISILADTADAGSAPDIVYLNGSVTVTPNVPVIRVGTIVATTTTQIGRIVNGTLLGPDGVSPFVLLATDTPGITPTPIQYTAVFNLVGATTNPSPVTFNLPGGTTVDIGGVVSAPAAAPVQTLYATSSSGSAGTTTIGTTTTGAPGTNASVTNTGTVADSILNFTIPRGAVGNPGAPGTSSTIAVGTTTTGAAGSSASVTNSGTTSAATLNFTIPQGQAGAPGAPGTGIPVGGTTNQILVKNSATNYDVGYSSTFPIGSSPATGVVFNIYNFSGSVWPVRPSNRTDLLCIWIGPTPPPSTTNYSLPHDLYFVATS